jgi:hypothetical protein
MRVQVRRRESGRSVVEKKSSASPRILSLFEIKSPFVYPPQMIDFVDNFYPVVASKCSSRSNVVLLKSATSRQVAGRSSPFIAHIGAGRRSWSCRLQRPTPDRRVVRMQDNGTRSRRVAAFSSKGVNATAAGSPSGSREYAWQRIAEFGNDDVRHQALRFPRPAQSASLFSSS